MNKFFKTALAVLVTMMIPAGSLMAQAPMGMQVPMAPIDSAVRVGKLDNGLTYYIRHNETPKGQADFFIAQNVGSILEDEPQRGLAHFLEHMCFNGTENFPGNSLIDWLETVGVKFGQNLNAYTSIDETVYNISQVPTARQGVIDSCLLILHDWADGLLLDPEEINKERGVIHEEWRVNNVGQMRIMEKLLPKVYPGNKYGERLPIGLMSVVDNFEPQVLRDYYEKWYRPDQQAIIVVGDINPDYIETKIKEIFSPIKMPENAAPREFLAVEDTPGTIYAIGSDPEMTVPVALLMFKLPQQMLPRELRGTEAYFGVEYLITMIEEMLQQRFTDMARQANCPFAQVQVSLGDFFVASTKDALMLQVVGKGNDIAPAVEAAYREVLRAVRGGFTNTEYERAKDEYIAQLQKMYDQREGRNNTAYAREYAKNFTSGDPIPGIAYELKRAKEISAQLPLQVINQVAAQLVSNDNRIVMLMLPENDTFKVPTEEEVAAVIAGVEAETIEAKAEEAPKEPLIASLPAPVEPKVSENTKWGATELVYPNGVKVIAKKTDFKPGEIVFSAEAKGGLASIDANPATVAFLPYAMYRHGLGNYNNSDLEKYLSGKNTNVAAEIDDYSREIAGTTTPANLRTLLELVYMTFKDYEITADDFAGIQEMVKASLANQESDPQFIFRKELIKNLYAAPSKQVLTSAGVEAANREESLDIIHTMFANPADFEFIFVGDINIDSLTALCNQYLGTLTAPRVASVPFRTNPAYEVTKGSSTVKESTKMAEPQTWLGMIYAAEVPFTAKERATASIGAQILSNRILKKIREEMGATYSAGAGGGLSRLSNQNLIIQIAFPMKPELSNQVLEELDKMINGMTENVTEAELAPIKEYMVKTARENERKNSSWVSGIAGVALNGVDTFSNAEQDAASVTVADVQNLFKQLLDQNNLRITILEAAE